jgi:hypothetical protein
MQTEQHLRIVFSEPVDRALLVEVEAEYTRRNACDCTRHAVSQEAKITKQIAAIVDTGPRIATTIDAAASVRAASKPGGRSLQNSRTPIHVPLQHHVAQGSQNYEANRKALEADTGIKPGF